MFLLNYPRRRALAFLRLFNPHFLDNPLPENDIIRCRPKIR
jgi:hypothetical protein